MQSFINNNLIKYLLAVIALAGIILSLFLVDFNPKLILAVLAFVFTVVIIKDYMIGIYLICLLIPLDAAATVIPGFTITKYIGIITIASFFIDSVMRGRTKFNKLNPYLLAFFAWAALSVLWAIDLNVYFSRLLNLTNYIVLVFMMLNSKRPEVNINRFLILYLIGCVILGVLGLQQFIIHGGMERVSAFGEDQNFYGITIGIGLLIALYLKRIPGLFTKQAILNITVLLLIMGLMVSLSRTAWVATAIAVAFYLLAGRQNRIKSALVSVGLVMVVYLIAYYTALFFETSMLGDRLLSIINFADSSNRAAGRLDIWIVGWNIFKDNFIVGVGLNNFGVAFTDQYVATSDIVRYIGVARDPHNIYLGISTELGLIGIALFAMIFISTFKRISRDIYDIDNKYFAYSLILFLLVAGLANSILYKKYFWFALIIIWLFGLGKDREWKIKGL